MLARIARVGAKTGVWLAMSKPWSKGSSRRVQRTLGTKRNLLSRIPAPDSCLQSEQLVCSRQVVPIAAANGSPMREVGYCARWCFVKR